MSRRYRNFKVGCGGHSRGRGRSTPNARHTNKVVEDYLFYFGSSKQASDYEITAEFVVNHIKIHLIAATMSQRHYEICSNQTQMSGSQLSRSVLNYM